MQRCLPKKYQESITFWSLVFFERDNHIDYNDNNNYDDNDLNDDDNDDIRSYLDGRRMQWVLLAEPVESEQGSSRWGQWHEHDEDEDVADIYAFGIDDDDDRSWWYSSNIDNDQPCSRIGVFLIVWKSFACLQLS